MNRKPSYLTKDELDQFWTEGYLVLKGTLDDEVVKTAREFILNLFPSDLTIPDYYHAIHGRFKPHYPDGNGSFFVQELLPLLQNEGLYRAASDILETEYIKVWDGSAGITILNRAKEGRIQNLHLDAVPSGPQDLNLKFLRTQIGIGGCYYLNKVEKNGGGIHVIPGGPNLVREIMLNDPDGLKRNNGWGQIIDFPPSLEVTANAGDYILMHHLMPHGASANNNNVPRIAQFTRFQPLSEGEACLAPGPEQAIDMETQKGLTLLGRKLFRIDPWIE